ncbi:D-aminoacyl-tRNA deacylase [Eremococcus coleocola]|uniref:D-aminoacyl-tRNA deacylase n=1 Tax=Eremococcus coleocola ACS-139-V-Col8 TaxID=908337 RepID=E4KM38_9LACT|nr:D-aminoacyl-tRNA deacylase [Eremococcus coleocola]EFR31987.1 D-tyrosyl-tRNA(Tyr) deacylase [Eremococcus coleocola ACS-139-V-Col8]
MRLVIQKCGPSSVSVDGQVIGAIKKGFVILVGVSDQDQAEDLDYCVRKVSKMRIFEDEAGKTNLNLDAVGGAILSISQFTLLADTRKGNRPSFVHAAPPEMAEAYYDKFNQELVKLGFEVQTGRFGADMTLNIQNEGPMTIILDSRDK